jgi:hypothetical protein
MSWGHRLEQCCGRRCQLLVSVQIFWFRRQVHTFHLDYFAAALEVVGEEGKTGKEVRVSSFLYTLRERHCFTFDGRLRVTLWGKKQSECEATARQYSLMCPRVR